MCYRQSQICNWIQKDCAIFLHSHGLSDIDLQGFHGVGLAVSKQTFHTSVKNAKTIHATKLQFVIKDALENGKHIALMVDDYTNVHTFRQPASAKNVDVAHMATVIIRILINQPFLQVDME